MQWLRHFKANFQICKYSPRNPSWPHAAVSFWSYCDVYSEPPLLAIFARDFYSALWFLKSSLINFGPRCRWSVHRKGFWHSRYVYRQFWLLTLDEKGPFADLMKGDGGCLLIRVNLSRCRYQACSTWGNLPGSISLVKGLTFLLGPTFQWRMPTSHGLSGDSWKRATLPGLVCG